MTPSPDCVNNPIKIYEPNHMMRSGIRIWPEMFHELFEFRGLIWRLILRDITARYKQSVLGILWAFLAPLTMMLVFVWVKDKNILPIKNTLMPYAAFVFSGQMIWTLFSQGIISSVNSLSSAGNLLTKINFPREVLILSVVGQTIFDFLIRIPLLFIIFAWVGFVPKLSIIFIPFILLPLLFLILGLGLIVALLNAVVRDVASALGIVMNLALFATPVIYPPPASWPFSFLVNTVNPVSSFITASRDLITSNTLTDPLNYFVSSILSLLIFFIGWRLFHLAEPKIAERV